MRRTGIRAARGVAAAGLALALTGCAGGERRVDADALASAGAERVLVLDVRSRGEFEAGHVPGAVHLPFQSTWTRRESLPRSLEAPIVVYCEHGPRAALARFGLESLGYDDVRTLDGHMARWRAEGRPVETGGR